MTPSRPRLLPPGIARTLSEKMPGRSPDLTSPTRAAVLTKRAAAGVRASGEQACWKGRGQEAGSMGRDPGENGRLNILLCKSEVWIINWCPNMKAFGGGSGPWQFRSCPSFFVVTSFSAAPEQALLPVAVPTQSSPHCSSGGSPPMRGGGTAQPRAGQTRLPPRDGSAWSHGSWLTSAYLEPGVGGNRQRDSSFSALD